MPILPGIDILLDQHLDQVAGRRIGLISNASGVTRDLISNVDALLNAPGVQLTALFGPEHGFHALAADGSAVESTTDPRTGLPVYSLYGATRKPTADMLAGLDVLIFDIQSVGVRFYTYVTTLLYAMQAAAEHGLAFIVCDRPNPIGGEIVEGPILVQGFESFVGPGRLPIRHGLSIGELARLYNEVWGVGCDLTVMRCAGWRRAMWFDETGLPWIPPSPAMPWPTTAIVYPGTCLIEGTNLSEGRGTTLPFHLVGAPWVDGRRLAETLNHLDLPGVRFRPATFRPASDKWTDQHCGGVQLHVTDRRTFRPVAAGLHLIATVQRLHPGKFAWRPRDRDEEKSAPCYIDLLAGTDQVRHALDADASVADLVASWAGELKQFAQGSRPHRLYQ